MTDSEHERISEYDRRFNGRLDRVEGIVETLATNQARVETTMTNLVSQIDHLSGSLTRYTTDAIQQSKTNWTMIWSAGTLVVALVVALGTGFVGKPLSNLETKVEAHVSMSDARSQETRKLLATLDRRDSEDHARSSTLNERYTKDIEYLKSLIHKDEEKMSNARDRTTNHESRIQNLERLIFPQAKYRDGSPD